jgi:hypothetical protein
MTASPGALPPDTSISDVADSTEFLTACDQKKSLGANFLKLGIG